MSLARFHEAQASSFSGALAELRAGSKRGHWIWWVLPQLRGLGQSSTSQHYGLAGVEEGRAYLEDPILRRRYLEALEALHPHVARGARLADILGGLDAMKLVSSLTLLGTLAREGADPEHARIAALAGEIGRAAQEQGVPPCRFTGRALEAASLERG